MKKLYFSAILFLIAIGINTAQEIEDDFESYTLEQPINEAHWTDWGCGGGAGCAIMSTDAQARSGSKSGLIPNDGTTDAVLDLGNKIFGVWGLSFWMYVPSGAEAYWNLQGEVPIGAGEWIVGNIHFNQDLATPGVGLIDNSALGAINFDFPHDQWFNVIMYWDISSGISTATWLMYVNFTEVIPEGTAFTDSAGTSPTSLGGIDFFSITTNNEYYIDDVYYCDKEGCIILNTESFNEIEFIASPNPVYDILHLSAKEMISEVTLYNLLGQEIFQKKINALDSSIDMSSYQKGIYILKTKIGDTEGSVKIIK
ncbi:MAG: hypothetical protein ACI9SJ_000111 [Flavobacteriaceae bacterium]|jgi:hypothetical protein|uniref:T9SS type A sorting domain-containing protein n=1 Tax=Candidatus Marifrigoribacter sp. Uisw_064 TaxID=3230970 RepID=UPI003AED5D0F